MVGVQGMHICTKSSKCDHMVLNKPALCLCMIEVISWVNLSQDDLFLEKKGILLVHAVLKNATKATHGDVVMQVKLAG